MTIGEKIKKRRLDLKMTLEDVGSAVGVGKSTVRKWETGMIQNMGRDKVELLADVLQMDPVEFIITGERVNMLRDAAREVRNDDEELLLHLFRGLSDDGRRLMIERAHELSILYGKKSDTVPTYEVKKG